MRYTPFFTFCFISVFALLTHCEYKDKPADDTAVSPVRCFPKIIITLPHDDSAFTQGLFYHKGYLYESTGLNGRSSLRKLDSSGTVLTNLPLPSTYFAEGCTFFSGNLYQLTWKKQRCFVYSMADFSCIDTLSYTGEGWGITSNNSTLFMSNGSDTLYMRNSNFSVTDKIGVTSNGHPLGNLNELEFVNGHIYANVWYSDYIFEIDPENGSTVRIIDCSELVARESPSSDEYVLNGIAYNPENGLFYITGKFWKNMFVVEIPPL
jgi:glutamine cyclotransferase